MMYKRHPVSIVSDTFETLCEVFSYDMAEEICEHCTFACGGRCICCGKDFDRTQFFTEDHYGTSYCSRKCADKHRRRIEYETKHQVFSGATLFHWYYFTGYVR